MNTFEKELYRRLDALKVDKIDVLTQTVLTHEDYLRQMGYLQCLRDVVAVCEAIGEEIIKT